MGADYEKQHRSILGAQTISAPAPNTTRYLNPGGSVATLPELDARMRIPYTCTVRNLYVRSTLAPGAGETYTYTIYLNGAPTAITCQIEGAVDVEADDLVNIVAVAAGDELTLEIAVSLNGVAAYHNYSFEVDR